MKEKRYSDIYKNLSMCSLKGEVWRDIKGYETMYQISSMGRVKSFLSKRILKQCFSGNKQLQVILCSDGVKKKAYVLMLVGRAFAGECDRNKNEVYCHLNMVKTDNRACNVTVVSKSEERVLAYRHGRLRSGNLGDSGRRTRFKPKYYYIGTRCDGSEERYTAEELTRKYGSSQRNIIRCVKGVKHFRSAYKMTWRRELISE